MLRKRFAETVCIESLVLEGMSGWGRSRIWKWILFTFGDSKPHVRLGIYLLEAMESGNKNLYRCLWREHDASWSTLHLIIMCAIGSLGVVYEQLVLEQDVLSHGHCVLGKLSCLSPRQNLANNSLRSYPVWESLRFLESVRIESLRVSCLQTGVESL